MSEGLNAFSQAYRVKHANDFKRSREASWSVPGKNLVVFISRSPSDVNVPRLGIVVTRKTGGAVRRNGWKRMIREVFRHHKRDLHAQVDYVVLVRKQVRENASKIHREELEQLFRRTPKYLARIIDMSERTEKMA